jgi:hypothetical protein
MGFVAALTLQYVLLVQTVHTVMELPLASLVATASCPSLQKQSVTRLAIGGEVQFEGHWLLTPVQHQEPGLHCWQGWLAVPLYPGAQ